MSKLLSRAAGSLLGGANGLRQLGYRSGWLRKVRLKAKVVSIGNLTVGGTGKTPVVMATARECLRLGKSVAIVSRNYKAQVSSKAEVDLTRANAAAYYGDEPVLLARSLPGVRVFVGPRKSETAAWAERDFGPFDVVIVDDGFQHWALERDLDVVLIDAGDEKTFELLPLGRGREDRSALARADVILLTKVNWAEPDLVRRAREHLPAGVPVQEVPFVTRWPEVEAVPLGVFSGLGRSAVFAGQARKKYFAQVQKVWSFADHQVYGAREVAEFKRFLCQDPRALLVTTEKDAVKIQDDELIPRLRTAGVEAQIAPGEVFFEKLRSLVR